MGWHSAERKGPACCPPRCGGLTRLISASLLSCRALSKPNAFPPAGDKEAAGKRGDLQGHAPLRVPARAAHRWRPKDARRGRARGQQAPTLEPVADGDRHGVRPTPDKARDNGEQSASGPEFRQRVATGPRGGGTALPDTPHPAGRPPPAPLPAAARARGIKAAVLLDA